MLYVSKLIYKFVKNDINGCRKKQPFVNSVSL